MQCSLVSLSTASGGWQHTCKLGTESLHNVQDMVVAIHTMVKTYPPLLFWRNYNA